MHKDEHVASAYLVFSLPQRLDACRGSCGVAEDALLSDREDGFPRLALKSKVR